MSETETTATLIVSRSYSTCGTCRRQTLPDAETHDTVSGYGGGQPGCGARFTAVTSDQADEYSKRQCTALRPDLPVVDYGSKLPAAASATPRCSDCGEELAHSGCTRCGGWACTNVNCDGAAHCQRDRAGWDACEDGHR